MCSPDFPVSPKFSSSRGFTASMSKSMLREGECLNRITEDVRKFV
jgi:hypothetical protein